MRGRVSRREGGRRASRRRGREASAEGFHQQAGSAAHSGERIVVSSVRAACLALRLLLRRRRVALEARPAHRASQRGERADVLVPRAPQHPTSASSRPRGRACARARAPRTRRSRPRRRPSCSAARRHLSPPSPAARADSTPQRVQAGRHEARAPSAIGSWTSPRCRRPRAEDFAALDRGPSRSLARVQSRRGSPRRGEIAAGRPRAAAAASRCVTCTRMSPVARGVGPEHLGHRGERRASTSPELEARHFCLSGAASARGARGETGGFEGRGSALSARWPGRDTVCLRVRRLALARLVCDGARGRRAGR